MASVNYTIDDADLPEFKIGFLKANPVKLDSETGQPVMSEEAWIKAKGKEFFLNEYKRGKNLILKEESREIIDENIIQ